VIEILQLKFSCQDGEYHIIVFVLYSFVWFCVNFVIKYKNIECPQEQNETEQQRSVSCWL
jgi:hypothetical protein